VESRTASDQERSRAYDVVVVGGGNAGMCAALPGREHGVRVLLIERALYSARGGNLRRPRIAGDSGSWRRWSHGRPQTILATPVPVRASGAGRPDGVRSL